MSLSLDAFREVPRGYPYPDPAGLGSTIDLLKVRYHDQDGRKFGVVVTDTDENRVAVCELAAESGLPLEYTVGVAPDYPTADWIPAV